MQTLITKIIALFMSIISAITGVGISNYTVSVQNNVTCETTVLEYEIKNNSLMIVNCSDYYTLSKYTDGQWVEMESEGEVLDTAVILMPFQSYSRKINLENSYDNLLEEGRYQLTVTVQDKDINTIFDVK